MSDGLDYGGIARLVVVLDRFRQSRCLTHHMGCLSIHAVIASSITLEMTIQIPYVSDPVYGFQTMEFLLLYFGGSNLNFQAIWSFQYPIVTNAIILWKMPL